MYLSGRRPDDAAKKTRQYGWPGFSEKEGIQASLLDFSFLVDYVLAYHRIVFLHFQFFGLGSLVLGGGIVMTGSSAGNQFNFFSHF